MSKVSCPCGQESFLSPVVNPTWDTLAPLWIRGKMDIVEDSASVLEGNLRTLIDSPSEYTQSKIIGMSSLSCYSQRFWRSSNSSTSPQHHEISRNHLSRPVTIKFLSLAKYRWAKAKEHGIPSSKLITKQQPCLHPKLKNMMASNTLMHIWDDVC